MYATNVGRKCEIEYFVAFPDVFTSVEVFSSALETNIKSI